MRIEDRVEVLRGATAWMKEWNYWLDDMGDNIDGLEGKIVGDYTDLPGNAAHYSVKFDGIDFEVGVNPMWLLEKEQPAEPDADHSPCCGSAWSEGMMGSRICSVCSQSF